MSAARFAQVLVQAAALAMAGAAGAWASDGAWDPGSASGAYCGGGEFPCEHVHGATCGHFHYGGFWHLFPREHVHGPGCGHYLVDGRWDYFPSAHRHSFECGHYFYNGMWNPFPPGHLHGVGCGHFFYGGCWNVFPEGHVHRPGCGHVFVDGEWRDAAPGEDAAPVARDAAGEEALSAPEDDPDAAKLPAEPEIPVTEEPQVVELRSPPSPPPPQAPVEPSPDRLILPVPAEVVALDPIYNSIVVLDVGSLSARWTISAGRWDTAGPIRYGCGFRSYDAYSFGARGRTIIDYGRHGVHGGHVTFGARSSSHPPAYHQGLFRRSSVRVRIGR